MADDLTKLERELSRQYATAKKEMKQKLKDFEKKFAAADAKQRDLLTKGLITPQQYKDWRQGQILHNQWFKDMISVYAKDQSTVNQRAAEIINKALPNSFAESKNFATYEIEKKLNINTNYTLYSKDAVAKLAKDKPKLLPKAKVNIPKDKKWNERKMRSAVMQGILQGETIPQISNRLANVTDMNRTSALRNARTMVGSAENMGQLDAFERANDLGINVQKTWLATLDDRVRDSHAELDGETVPVDEPFSNGLMCPKDPEGEPAEVYNCRCRMIAQIKGFERDVSDLSMRNTDHFPYKSYEDWKNAHGTPLADKAAIAATTATLTIRESLDKCTTPTEVQELMAEQEWFYVEGDWYDGNKLIDLTKADLDGAKDIYRGYEKVFEKYPQLIGKMAPPKVGKLNDPTTMAQCIFGFGRGGITCSTKYYGNYELLKRTYARNIGLGFHPIGTSQDAVVVHELGHAIDDMLTNLYHLNSGKNKSVSSELRAKVARSTGVKVRDFRKEVSDYAAKDAHEWFAECFSEYMTSNNPRKVAKEFGKMLDEIMRGVE